MENMSLIDKVNLWDLGNRLPDWWYKMREDAALEAIKDIREQNLPPKPPMPLFKTHCKTIGTIGNPNIQLDSTKMIETSINDPNSAFLIDAQHLSKASKNQLIQIIKIEMGFK